MDQRYISDLYDEYKSLRHRVTMRMRDEIESYIDALTYDAWLELHEAVREAYAAGVTKTELRKWVRAHQNQSAWGGIWDQRERPIPEPISVAMPQRVDKPKVTPRREVLPVATVEQDEHGWKFTLNREPDNWSEWTTLSQRKTQWAEERHYEATFPEHVWVDNKGRPFNPHEDPNDNDTQQQRRWFWIHKDLWMPLFNELKDSDV